MMMKFITPILLILFLLPVACVSKGKKDEPPKKLPNILLLFSDQHNKKVMGFEGHPDVITPNLDKLASQGVVFDRAYTARGVCAPSRTTLMSGLFPRTTGILANGDQTKVMDDAVSMASILQYNGYKTYAFGKRHLKGALEGKGWDVKKGHAYNSDDDDNYVSWIERNGYMKEFARDWAAEHGNGPKGSSMADTKIPTADLGTRVSELPEDFTMEAYTMKETIDLIKNQANEDQPFFCWASFYRPHQPYTPLKKYMDMYDVSTWGEGTRNGGAIKKSESFYEPTENLPPLLQSQRNGGNKVWNMDKAFEKEQLWRNFIGAYYALVTEIDDRIGQIIKALEDAGIEDETLIIYTADHGDFVGNHGMVEKAAYGHNVYEDILNIPLIIKYPGKTKAGKHSAELVTNADILPTLIDLLDLKVPQLNMPLEGKSLAGILQNGGSLNRNYIVSEGWSQASVITKDYKLGIWLDPHNHHGVRDYRDFGDMFFDRQNDPLELHNRINESRYHDDIQRLRTYYEQFKAEYPDTGKQEQILADKKKASLKD